MLNQKDGAGGCASRMTQWWSSWRMGVFGCMFIMSKKVSVPAWRTKLELVIRIAQMLAFVVSSRVGREWPGPMYPVQMALNFLNTSFLYEWYRYQLYLTLYYIAFSWVVLLILLMLYGIVGFMRSSFPSLLPLKVLRMIGNLSAGPLYIPLLQMLLSTYQCSSAENLFWRDASYSCSSTPFILQQAASAILAAALCMLAFLFAAIFYESNSLSSMPDARVHGRADIVMLVVQAALVIMGQTFNESVSTWAIILTAAIAGFAWLTAYLYFMPYYDHAMNSYNLAGAGAFLWAVLCLTINNYYNGADAAIMLFCGLPVGALAGYALAGYRTNRVLRTDVDRYANPYEVELRARYMLHAAVWGHPTERANDSAQYSLLNRRRLKAGEDVELGENIEDVGGDGQDALSEAAKQIREVVPQEVLHEVQQMYRHATLRFRSASMLHVSCARFYAAYLGNRHMQFSHLLQAEKRHPPMDVAYLVFQARKLAENNGAGGGGLSAMHRVTFEKYAGDARRYVQVAAQKQLAFWTELIDPVPDLSRLHKLATETNDAITAAEKAFVELFAINPQSISVIRLYSAFNLHVTSNAEKAAALTAEADRLEDMKSKDHSLDGAAKLQFLAESSLDIMAENTAILSIGASARNLGLIVSANAAACKLFGYARLQLERRSAFTLLPPVLDRFHEKALKRYVSTGEGSIVDYNRIMFGLHKGGAIIPILSSLRDAPADAGPPAFIWLIRELRTPNQYMMLDDNFVVIGACSSSLSLLCVDADGISGRNMRIADFIAEFELPNIQQELASVQGAALKVCAFIRRPASDPANDVDGESIASDRAADHGADDETPRFSPESRVSKTMQEEVVQCVEVWVRAYLQRASLEDLSVWILHWQRINDATTLDKAEGRRTKILGQTSDARGSSMSMAAGATAAKSTVIQPDPVHATRRSITFAAEESAIPLRLTAAASSRNVYEIQAFGNKDKKGGALSPDTSRDRPTAHDDDLLSMLLPGAVASPSTRNDDAADDDTGLSFPQLRIRSERLPPQQSTGSEVVAEAVTEDLANQSVVPSEANNAISPRTTNLKASINRVAMANMVTSKRSGSGSVKRGDDVPEGESLHSGSSKATSASKVLTRLRRALSDGTRTLLPGLWMLRLVGILITGLAIILATVVALQATDAFEKYVEDIDYIAIGGERVVHKSDSIMHMQNLLYYSRGWISLSEEEVQLAREGMAGNATKFAQLNKEMFNAAQGTGLSQEFTTRYITMTRFDRAPNGIDGRYQIMNLVEVGSAFANLMLDFSTANLTEYARLHGPALDSITYDYMKGGNGHDVLVHATNLGYDRVLQTKDVIFTTQMSIFIAMCAIIFAIGGGVFFPILNKIETSADAIMQQFVMLPLVIRQAMHRQATRRLRVLRKDFAQDDDLEVTTDEEEEEAALRSEKDVASPSDVEGGMSDSMADDTDVDWDALIAGKPKSNRRTKSGKPTAESSSRQRRQQTFRKSGRSFAVLVLRFIAPLVCLFILFSVVFARFATTLDRAVTMTSVATAATMRASCARQAVIDLRKLSTLTTDAKYIRNSFWYTMTAAQCVRDHVRLLAYGDKVGMEEPYLAYTPPAENGITTVFDQDTTSLVFNAMFSDACEFLTITGIFANMTSCKSATGKAVEHGLASAVEEWYSKLYYVADRQLRGAFIAGKLFEGHGWLLDSNTFNYTAAACTKDDGCEMRRSVAIPADGSNLPPSPISDLSYEGDFTDTDPAPPGATPYRIAREINSDEVQAILAADAKYMTPAFYALAAIYQELGRAEISSFLQFLGIFMPCFMVGLVLIMIFIFLPQIHRTNTDIYTKRTMLLYLPPQVVAGVPAIQTMLQDILAKDSGMRIGGSK